MQLTGVLIPTGFEAGAFLKRLEGKQRLPVPGVKAWRGTVGGQHVAVALCGMGPKHSAERARHFLQVAKPSRLILAGFAGGLDPELKLGDVVRAEGEGIAEVVHTTAEVVPTAKGKRRLWQETGRRVVEMEAAAVAEVASEFHVPLAVIRVISDDRDEALPGCLQYGYDMELGRESPLRMALYLATHPREIPTLKLFLKRTSPCADIVAEALVKELG